MSEAASPSRPGEAGQASVELVAVLPALLVCALLGAQAVAAGWALWSAGNAARAGARADLVGRDPGNAARGALPASMRGAARVRGAGRTRVSVEVAALLPGAEPGRLSSSASLDASR